MATAPSIKGNKVVEYDPYQRRVKLYMQSAAVNIMAEDPATANHAERIVYAGLVLGGEASVIEYAYGTMTNLTILAEADVEAENQGIPDTDLSFAVDSLFNAFAGIAT